ncbi:MAG TPA: AzlD domain-containing protein [Miltoncostaeaceae bacterium]|nr:AzlD domain-containing protein [Miltoncostaeaceae bacterium]
MAAALRARDLGVELQPDLHVAGGAVRKGQGGEDGYSGFPHRDLTTGEDVPSELRGLLEERGVERLVVVAWPATSASRRRCSTRAGWAIRRRSCSTPCGRSSSIQATTRAPGRPWPRRGSSCARRGRALPARLAGVVGLLPAAVFAALIVVDTLTQDGELTLDARAAGVGAAAVAAWRDAPFLVVVGVAMAVTAAVRALPGA